MSFVRVADASPQYVDGWRSVFVFVRLRDRSFPLCSCWCWWWCFLGRAFMMLGGGGRAGDGGAAGAAAAVKTPGGITMSDLPWLPLYVTGHADSCACRSKGAVRHLEVSKLCIASMWG